MAHLAYRSNLVSASSWLDLSTSGSSQVVFVVHTVRSPSLRPSPMMSFLPIAIFSLPRLAIVAMKLHRLTLFWGIAMYLAHCLGIGARRVS